MENNKENKHWSDAKIDMMIEILEEFGCSEEREVLCSYLEDYSKCNPTTKDLLYRISLLIFAGKINKIKLI